MMSVRVFSQIYKTYCPSFSLLRQSCANLAAANLAVILTMPANTDDAYCHPFSNFFFKKIHIYIFFQYHLTDLKESLSKISVFVAIL
jgi:hypothetical protein